MAENDSARTDAFDAPNEDRETSEEAVARDLEQDLMSDEPSQADDESMLAELEAARNLALRSQAELENYRKRAARQMAEERRYANLPLMRDLLHVWDDMGRAIEAADEQADRTGGLLEGFKMVARQMEAVFERYHCAKIEAQNHPFDPHLHEAISQQPSKEHPPGTVILETRVGFQLHDRVVRPSQVIVSAAVPKPVSESQSGPKSQSVSEPEGIPRSEPDVTEDS